MSQQAPRVTPTAALSGLLWCVGGLLAALGAGLLAGLSWAILVLALWCLMTSWSIGRRV